MNVAVIGAGPAGLAAAYQLSKAKVAVDVLEAGESVGGLARTLTLWGQRVDLGPHRFLSSDRRVNELWLEVVGRDYEMVNRLTRIFYRGKFFLYPLKPLDAIGKLGPVEAAACLGSYLQARMKTRLEDGSFETWVRNRFGQRLFSLFFRSYSEKLWGISCRELDSDFAAQRIKKLTLGEAIKDAFKWKRTRAHKTLADQFAYPTGGTGMVYERMAARIKDMGGQVFCGSPVERVLLKQGRVTGLILKSGAQREYEHVISTMPLNCLVAGLPGVPQAIQEHAAALGFRNTIIVYLHVDGVDLFPDNWLYVHAPEVRVGRITNFRNWVPHLYGQAQTTILALEYWCDHGDDLWRLENDLVLRLAKEELKKTGLAGEAPVLDGAVYRIHRCYPVYARGYRNHLGPLESYLSNVAGLSVIGRYGAFKYNNQDHSLLMGILAAENILKGASHDLWGINTDYESYLEATVITKTGLIS